MPAIGRSKQPQEKWERTYGPLGDVAAYLALDTVPSAKFYPKMEPDFSWGAEQETLLAEAQKKFYVLHRAQTRIAHLRATYPDLMLIAGAAAVAVFSFLLGRLSGD